TINLSSSSPAAVVPATVVVPAGQIQANFNVTTNAAAAQNTIDVLISATFQQRVTQTARLTVQVVTVAISPTELTIFVGHGQQFSATVTGATDRSVTWSVQEAGAGSVNASGLFVPQAVGDFHVVASSVANPAARAIATVHVRTKPKDKEKEKEKEFEKPINEKISREKVRETKVREVIMSEALSAAAEDLDSDDGAALGRAFIRPAERPDTTPRVAH
ncbi:MAG: Ig-like domain-containing protein, partial [Solimonas sp.]